MIDTAKLEDGVLAATLTGPQNRLQSRHLAQLTRIVRQVDSDASLSGLVVTGAGEEYFCSGGPRTADPGVASDWATGSRAGFPPHRKPVVAAVNGDALGGGFALALACDAVVAVRRATFGSSLVAGFASDDEMALAVLLADRLGEQRAAELMYTGRRLTCDQAHTARLVGACVDDARHLHRVACATVTRMT